MTSENLPSRTEAVAASAGALARWATRTSVDLARKLPGAAAVEAEWHRFEQMALTELRHRLDHADPLGGGLSAVDSTPLPDIAGVAMPTGSLPPSRQTEPLRAAMAELLLRSMEQTAHRAREYYYLSLLRQLVPDEARILSALADGSTFPAVHVDIRTGVAGTERLLSNASTMGRAAGVADLPAVPRYVTRLRSLDLVELRDADPELSVSYEILLSDSTVRAAEEEARTRGGRGSCAAPSRCRPWAAPSGTSAIPMRARTPSGPTPVRPMAAPWRRRRSSPRPRRTTAPTAHRSRPRRPGPRPAAASRARGGPTGTRRPDCQWISATTMIDCNSPTKNPSIAPTGDEDPLVLLERRVQQVLELLRREVLHLGHQRVADVHRVGRVVLGVEHRVR